MILDSEIDNQDGEDSVQGVWEQRDEDPHVGSGCGGKDNNLVQTKVGSVSQHHSNRGLQCRDSHLQECQI